MSPLLIHARVGNRALGRADALTMSMADLVKKHYSNGDLRSTGRGRDAHKLDKRSLTPIFGKNRNEDEIRRNRKSPSPTPTPIFGNKRDTAPSSFGNRKGRAQTPMPRVGDALLFGKDSQSLRRKSDDSSRISEDAEGIRGQIQLENSFA